MLRALAERFRELMSVPSGNDELLKAQHRASSRQIPMMYFILLTSSWALAATHLSLAPALFTIIIPLAFTFVCVLRIAFWWRSRHRDVTTQQALAALRRTNALSAAIAVAFTAWALTLFPYGDAYTQSHIAFYMAITVVTCVFCLMHLRSAAIKVAAIVDGSFIVFFGLTGHPTFLAITINVILVSIGMLAVLVTNNRTFEKMILANQRSEALSKETLRIASQDGLTALPNRQAFFAHLEQAVGAARGAGQRLAVAVLDLDRFKPINELYGHAVGDKVLLEVSQRLSTYGTLHQFYLARLDNNAFAITFTDAPDDETLIGWADEMCAVLRAPFVLPEATIVVSTSIGLAVLPDTGCTWEQLLDRADYALDCGKRSERGHSTIFSAIHYAQINRNALIEQMLKQADLDDELRVVFQPIIDVRSNDVAGFEALARWHNRTLGDTAPHEFFAIAERAGLVGKLTRPLLRKSLSHACEWPAHIRLSFNLSAHDLNSAEGVLAIVTIVEASGFDPHRIDFEITETAFAHDFEQVRHSIQMLRHLGCGMSLDDFGTGYSSLARLHALPLTKIKIDRQFVTDIHMRPPSFKIVKSLLALSRDMDLGCVVEGVETEEELAAVIGLGGSLVQGYYYSRPLPAADTTAYLAARHTSARATAAPADKMAANRSDDLPSGVIEFARQFDPATLDALLAGITASDMATAIFDPQDRLVFLSPMFKELYDVEDGDQTFSSIIRHCHESRRGPSIDTSDIEAWLAAANAKRRTIRHRRFEVDLSDGRWLRALETTYGEGWVLVALMDLTTFKMKEIDLRIARDTAVMIAETDHLTGLASRGSIMRYLAECVDAQRPESALTIAIVDIDHFKQINDQLGHDAGDQVLHHFGQHSGRMFRNSDRVGRVGGEEFLVVMPNTDLESGRKAIERLRLQWRRGTDGSPDACTFSAGLCQWQPGQSSSDIYRAADHALYAAKSTGRGRTVDAPAPAQSASMPRANRA